MASAKRPRVGQRTALRDQPYEAPLVFRSAGLDVADLVGERF